MAFRRNAVIDLSSGGPQSYEGPARISTAKTKKLVFVRTNLKLVAKDYDPRPSISPGALTQWRYMLFLWIRRRLRARTRTAMLSSIFYFGVRLFGNVALPIVLRTHVMVCCEDLEVRRAESSKKYTT